MSKYEPLPLRNHHEHWAGRNLANFSPTARQAVLMDTYKAAKAAGLFYTSDVLIFAKEHLSILPEVAVIGCGKVDGGDLGMDIYYARDAVNNIEKRDCIKVAHEQLKPIVGMSLGALSINYKRTNAAVITDVSGFQITFTAKRGIYQVSGTATALQLLDAANTAVSKNWRKAALA